MVCNTFKICITRDMLLGTCHLGDMSNGDIPMVNEQKELVFNRESEHCVFPLDVNGRVPGGPSARFSVSWLGLGHRNLDWP